MIDTWRRRLISNRIYLLIVAHLAILGVSYELAFQLRFDWDIPYDERVVFWSSLPAILALKLIFLHRFGSLHGWWRHVTFADLASLLNASTLSTLAISGLDYYVISQYQIPRAVLLLDWGTTILLLGGLRSVWRLVRDHIWPTLRIDSKRRPTFLIAPAEQAEVLARQIHAHPRLDYRVIGFLDDNGAHHDSLLGGIPVLGSPNAVVQLARENQVRDVLLLARCLPGAQLRSIMDACHAAQIQLKTIPPFDEMVNGGYRLHIRDIDINDLLRRPPVQLDDKAIGEMIQGRRVVVTGAGGSIGSEICRQLLKHSPESLILVERSENSLFHIDRELIGIANGTTIHPCIADIRDDARMRALFVHHRPQLLFHCAAHKHVPLMEINAGEAIKNNVFGTVALVNLADEFEIERFVMISTDKAVNPTSVMGVTKQLAERYVHACSESSATRFVVVRFGNVLASAGSVVPIFQEQIRRGGPVTVTHAEMRRFFMTIPEASQLVLQAAAMGDGGEIFVLDMGQPVKILDLARDLVRLSGLGPDDIEIRITGMRPGEKLFEELYLNDEEMLPTPHPKLRVAYHRPYHPEEVLASISELEPLLHEYEDLIRAKLMELVTEYTPPESSSPGESPVHNCPAPISSPAVEGSNESSVAYEST